jgi:tRNA-2-methylthio-N6-dimethylallyladenosine synthase
MTGCNNFCSYCVVPHTRGREKSRPADEIIKEIKNLIKIGCKEILLLGQNVNSYKSASSATSYSSSETRKTGRVEKSKPNSSRQARTINNVNFSQLLRLINALPGDFTIKFLSSHPKDMSDSLINAIAECEKVSKEIHLPVQSGDNTILRKMNRKYTAAHYKKLIKKIRQKMPNAIISTDVIVGFPGETKKQFANTVKLFKELKFAKAYIAQYSPRPGTAAYKLKDNVSIQEKKHRWKILNEIINKKNN